MISDVIQIKLEQLLKERGKSLYKVAQETGIAYNALSKIKKGDVTDIRLTTLEKLCLSLECTPNDLLVFSEEN